MREDSPRWEQINASAYTWEQNGLRELASYLPDADPYSYHLRADHQLLRAVRAAATRMRDPFVMA